MFNVVAASFFRITDAVCCVGEMARQTDRQTDRHLLLRSAPSLASGCHDDALGRYLPAAGYNSRTKCSECDFIRISCALRAVKDKERGGRRLCVWGEIRMKPLKSRRRK